MDVGESVGEGPYTMHFLAPFTVETDYTTHDKGAHVRNPEIKWT